MTLDVKITHAAYAIEPKRMTGFVIHFVNIWNMNIVKAENLGMPGYKYGTRA